MESLLMKADGWLEALETSSVADVAATHKLGALPTRLLLSLRTPYDKTKLAYLVYLQYLLDLFHTNFPFRKSVVAFSEEKSIPLVVLRQMLALFADASQTDSGFMSYLQPKQKKDQLILYMLVLALTVNGFSLDLTELAADLKRSAPSYVVVSVVLVDLKRG
jgi:DNA-directed RNA polymerase I subunit RPA49